MHFSKRLLRNLTFTQTKLLIENYIPLTVTNCTVAPDRFSCKEK